MVEKHDRDIERQSLYSTDALGETGQGLPMNPIELLQMPEIVYKDSGGVSSDSHYLLCSLREFSNSIVTYKRKICVIITIFLIKFIDKIEIKN